MRLVRLADSAAASGCRYGILNAISLCTPKWQWWHSWGVLRSKEGGGTTMSCGGREGRQGADNAALWERGRAREVAEPV